MTHTSDPVPFIMYRPGQQNGNGATAYDEIQAKMTGLYLAEGQQMMRLLTA
jgi:2,3-bisphosphoglycerate-independent phosphoglycerate mutase